MQTSELQSLVWTVCERYTQLKSQSKGGGPVEIDSPLLVRRILEELGELTEEALRLDPAMVSITSAHPVAMEIADVLNTVFMLVHVLQLDVETIMERKLNTLADRSWLMETEMEKKR